MEEIAGGSLVSLPGRGISSRVASERPVPVDALNLETPRTALGPTVTPAGSFFVRSHFPVPELRVGAWKLAISGEVDRPRAWSLADLHDLPRKRVVATLECAGNGRKGFRRPAPGELRWGDHAVGTAVWEGVPLSVLLNEAGLRCEAHHLVFSGADYGDPGSRACRFSRSLSLDLTGGQDDVLVATEMNGRSLAPEHGAPARLVVPGWYGMAWVKWLSTIVARRTPFRGYFQAARYVYRSRQGGRVVVEPVRRIRVKSLIIDPGGAEPLVRGRRYPISGKAWSGAGPITKVEVDAGSGWNDARVYPGSGPYDWSTWETSWRPGRAGRVVLRVRATDILGESQPEIPFQNDFQYGYNAIQRIEVRVR